MLEGIKYGSCRMTSPMYKGFGRMTSEHIRTKIKEYIQSNFVFEENGELREDQSLLKTGIVDSTGILELIAYVEEEFNVHFQDGELVADNFDTIERVTACVERKLSPVAS
jgi:acyl carrier protein